MSRHAPGIARGVLAGAVGAITAWIAARGGLDGVVGAEVLFQCNESGVERGGVSVVRTDSAWRAVWPQVQYGSCRPARGADPPAVDFGRRAVLVVAHGYAGSTGHSIRVARVERRGDTTRVFAVRRAPPPGCPVGDQVMYPVVALAVPRALADGTVRLETRTELVC
jgi:hypothetical protein